MAIAKLTIEESFIRSTFLHIPEHFTIVNAGVNLVTGNLELIFSAKDEIIPKSSNGLIPELDVTIMERVTYPEGESPFNAGVRPTVSRHLSKLEVTGAFDGETRIDLLAKIKELEEKENNSAAQN